MLSLNRAVRKFVSHKNVQIGSSRFRSSVQTPSSPSTITNTNCLSQPLPGLPPATYVSSNKINEDTQITVLENGIRVASERRFGQFCTVGVAIDSGSRYEVAFPSGISHYLEKLAFHSTSLFPSKDHILQRLEKYGGICDCQSTRDTFLYAASVDSRGLEPTVEILGEVVLRPQFSPEELEMCEMTIRYELEDIAMRPDQEPLLVEKIHAAAFKCNTLGLPKICPEENIGRISRQTLYTYLSAYHRPERMVVAGVGVEHEVLVEAVQKYFVDTPPAWKLDSKVTSDRSVAQYTGGQELLEKDLGNVSLGPTPMPELGHLVVGLESVGHHHDDFIPFCVLNMMMGGGGSFSAGGPGKGMYTRLYTRVLNRYHWMYSATAYNHAYNDSGIFCIHASCPPQMLQELTQVLLRELVAITGEISQQELLRAQTQLKSMLLMNLESRPVIFEDCARQVLSMGHRRKPEHFISLIDKVTIDDINRIGQKMLDSKAAVAAIGTLKKLPSYSDIEIGLLDKDGSLPSRNRFQLFR